MQLFFRVILMFSICFSTTLEVTIEVLAEEIHLNIYKYGMW